MGGNAQSRMFLQCIEDNCLMQMVVELVRSDVPLDLVLTKKEGLSGDVKAGGSLGWSDHEMAEFKKRDLIRSRFLVTMILSSIDGQPERATYGEF